MCDDGNCAEVPNTHIQVFRSLSLQKGKTRKFVQ